MPCLRLTVDGPDLSRRGTLVGRHWGAVFAFHCVMATTACGGGHSPSEQEEGQLVLAPLLQLSLLSEADDPLSSHRPEEIDCNNLVGWSLEDGQLEVNTAECNYLALTEPAAVSASQGARAATRIQHFDLTSAEPAEAHLALFHESNLLWETNVPIPSPAEVMEIEFELPVEIEKGDSMVFHLHNHGQNTWNIAPIVVLAD